MPGDNFPHNTRHTSFRLGMCRMS